MKTEYATTNEASKFQRICDRLHLSRIYFAPEDDIVNRLPGCSRALPYELDADEDRRIFIAEVSDFEEAYLLKYLAGPANYDVRYFMFPLTYGISPFKRLVLLSVTENQQTLEYLAAQVAHIVNRLPR